MNKYMIEKCIEKIDASQQRMENATNPTGMGPCRVTKTNFNQKSDIFALSSHGDYKIFKASN